MRNTGRYEKVVVGGETVSAFVPAPLPARRPPLLLEGTLAARYAKAEHALSRLDLAGEMVPSIDWFVYGFVRKEAVITSQIEGTKATLVDLLTFEAQSDTAPSNDVREVSDYLDALDYARTELASPKGLPLSMRLLNETHRRLMQGPHGHGKAPGEIRRTQNWIGGSRPGNARYVPPPAHRVPELLSALEKYIHGNDSLPPLVRAGLAHVQFEAIHPYLDGNGRIGRLLIALLLEHWRLLRAPLLYLSLFFKEHQGEYYRRLGAVRGGGDFEGWIDFYLDGIATVADEATASARDLFALVSADRARVLAMSGASVFAVRLFENLPRNPIVTIASAMRILETTKPTASRAVDGLVQANVLAEITGRRRDRTFAYRAYLGRLRAGTDLP